MRLIQLLAILALIISAPSPVIARVSDASIELMIGDPSCFSVERDGVTLQVTARMPLSNGDAFVIAGPDCRAALRLGDEIRDPVLLADTPLVIDLPGGAVGRVDRA